jgi:hypothetical protein
VLFSCQIGQDIRKNSAMYYKWYSVMGTLTSCGWECKLITVTFLLGCVEVSTSSSKKWFRAFDWITSGLGIYPMKIFRRTKMTLRHWKEPRCIAGTSYRTWMHIILSKQKRKVLTAHFQRRVSPLRCPARVWTPQKGSCNHLVHSGDADSCFANISISFIELML